MNSGSGVNVALAEGNAVRISFTPEHEDNHAEILVLKRI